MCTKYILVQPGASIKIILPAEVFLQILRTILSLDCVRPSIFLSTRDSIAEYIMDWIEYLYQNHTKDINQKYTCKELTYKVVYGDPFIVADFIDS